MRTETITRNIYTYSEASEELKDKIRENFDDGFLYEHHMEERINTLKAFADYIGADLDYSLSCVPSRGEFISVKPHWSYHSMYSNLEELLETLGDCVLTGVCYDDDLINYIKESKESISDEKLKEAFNKYIKSMHEEYEYMLTDEYLSDLCEANNYEFYDDGTIV